MVYPALLPLMHTPQLPVASTLHTTSEHGVSSITTADAHTSADSNRLNWRPLADLNGLVPFAERRNLVYCACTITFQLASTTLYIQQLVCITSLYMHSASCFSNCASTPRYMVHKIFKKLGKYYLSGLVPFYSLDTVKPAKFQVFRWLL